LTREAWEGSLLPHRAGDRVVDLHEVAAGGEVRVGEHVGGGVRGGDRHVAVHAGLFDLGGGAGPCPVRDDAVDLVAVGGPVGELREARVVEQVGTVHGLAQAGEVGVAAGDDAHVPAVGRRVVVERRRVRQAISFASAYHAERVVCGDRPLQD